MALPFQTALVTGANGFIGGALVLRLLAEGITVRAMCRNPINGQFLTGAEVVQGDVVDADQLVRLAHGCDVIFHLAAVGAGSAAIQNRVNIAGAENVARAAIAAGVGRLIHVSTVAVYGMHLRGSVTENTPFNPSPRDFYQQSKTTGERAVWQIAAQADLPLVVIRPALVYGPRSMLWTRSMYTLCRRLRAIPALPGLAHPIYVDDLVDLLIAAASHPAAPGQAFNGSAEAMPWATFLGGYAHLAGIDRTLTISPNIMRGLVPFAWLIEHGLALMGTSQDLRGALAYLSSDAVYRNEKARDRLGWQPRTSLAQGMARCAAWLKDQ